MTAPDHGDARPPARTMPPPPTTSRRRLPRWATAAARVLPVAAYPVVFLAAHNAAQLALGDLWLPLGFFVAAGALVLTATAALSGRWGAATLLTQVAVLLGAHYRALEGGVRGSLAFIRYWHLAPSLAVTVALVALHARDWPGKRQATAEKLAQGVAWVFSGLILFNALAALPELLASVRWRAPRRPAATASAPLRGGHGPDAPRPATPTPPNVYYIVLDEYSNFDAIQRHYDHDNSPFLHFLRDRGFNVSLTSRNATSATNIELTNIMEMQRVVSSATPDAERYRRFRRGRLLEFFKHLGYSTVVVSTVWQDYVQGDITYRGVQWGGRQDGAGESLVTMLLDASILYPLRAALTLSAGYIEESFTFLAETHAVPPPVFVFSHLRSPHEPFLFDAEGRIVPPEHRHNWRDKRHYLGFFIYTTRRIQDVLGRILDRDPDAVILLQSDHGARASERGTGRRALDIPEADQRSILNAVYFRGEPLDIEGLDGFDTGLRVYEALFGPEALGEFLHD